MPPEVMQDDVEYARPEGCPLLARIYRPRASPAEPRPLLVDVHGGAWTYFDREVDWYFDSALAADGMVVVALDFRLGRRRDPTPPRDALFMPERLIESHEMFFGDEATMARASALRVVEAGEAEGLPPIWIAHPELDENVTLPMTERFVAAYRRAGGAAGLEVFP